MPKEKLRVIYPGYNSIFSKKTVLFENNKPFLLYVGNRTEYKGFFDLLRGYAQSSWYRQLNLFVAGEEFLSEEKKTIEELKITNYVKWIGNVNDEELCVLYNNAAGFVYPSWMEGFGIPLLEAMSCGCPIIASRIPTTIEVASDIPFYFEPRSPELLAAALDQAMEEGRKSPRITRGFDQVKNFSWEKTARITLNVYQSLV